MKNSLNKDTIISIGFYGGLFIKAIDALIEFVSGLLLLILNHDLLNRLILLAALPEQMEDPNDMVVNYFISLGQNLSISSQHSVAIYLLLHGTIKLAVIWLLVKKKMWAFPLAVVIFVIFISYEIYSYTHSFSVLLLLFIIIDVMMVIIIILEYKRLKVKKAKKEM